VEEERGAGGAEGSAGSGVLKSNSSAGSSAEEEEVEEVLFSESVGDCGREELVVSVTAEEEESPKRRE
jgi:hypothetical protein